MSKSCPVFQFSATVRGNYRCTYVFENEDDFCKWIKTTYPKLVQKYGKLNIQITKLDSIKIGETCFVSGEGYDEFTIKDFRKVDDNIYSFLIHTGCWEAVHKCFKNLERGPLPQSLKLKCQKLGFTNVLMQNNYICLEK